MHRHTIASLCASALLTATGASAQIRMTLLNTVDLDSTANVNNSEFIGTNPAAIAWDGTDLYLAGFNNSNGPANIALVKVSGALGTPTFGTAFGTQSGVPAFRGFSGLDLQNGRLYAALDIGSSSADGITAWDAAGTQLWSKAARGGSGVGGDPGFQGGAISGAGWTTFGSGRRALQDGASGADIYTTGNGMIILTGSGTFWRDMDFDPDSGDIWLRKSNKVITGTRTGDNGVTNMRTIVDLPTGDFINQQNIAYANNSVFDVVFFNDRSANNTNQGFDIVIQAIRADGTSFGIDWGSFTATPGNGSYDFAWDAASGTLAILDFANRDAHIFQVAIDPYLNYGIGCAGSGGIIPELNASGTGQAGTTLNLDVTNGVGNGTAFLLFGGTEGDTPYAGSCSIRVAPLLDFFLGPQTLGGSGAGNGTTQFQLALPASAAGVQLTMQAAIIDLGIRQNPQVVVSNGVFLLVQ